MKIFILVVFILTYVLIISMPKHKMFITLGSAILTAGALLIFGKATFLEVLTSIDYNVVLMLLGIMITVGLFSDSGMPNKLSEKLVASIPNTMVTLVLLSVLSGVISAFIDNVATVLMLAPIGLQIAKKTNVSPIPVIIAIAVSSNLQGAATLVGDTTSIMLGGYANMSFIDFLFMDGRLSIFWAVELGMVFTIPVLFFLFRKSNKRLTIKAQEVEVTSIIPTLLLVLTIIMLIIFSFVPKKPDITNGLICMSIAIIGIIYFIVKEIKLLKQESKDDKTLKKSIIKFAKDSIDYETIVFLISLFVIIFAVDTVGIIDDIAGLFVKVGGKRIFLLYTLIVFISVIASAFIDNIPYVATMLPVIKGLVSSINAPYNIEILLYFGLLCGATLGGNLTPVGASANVVGIGILRKEGYEVKNSDFFKIGIPFTAVAVLAGYLFCWLVWAY